jgi:hypothetical protein
MATLIQAIKDRAFLNGPRLDLTMENGVIDGLIKKTNFTSTDENGEVIEYLEIPLVEPIMVGMSTDPTIGQFEVSSVYIREILLHTLTIEDNVRQGDKGLYFVRHKDLDGKKVEVEFVADISSTHTDQAGFAFCVYQHEKISSWIKNRRKAESEKSKTSRQTLLEQIRQRRNAAGLGKS